MKTAVKVRRIVVALAALTWLGVCDRGALGQDAKGTNLEVHEWSVWVADPNLENANARDRYVSGMPSWVNSVRTRDVHQEEARLTPMNVITFYGEPVPDQEVTLQVPSGQFLAHWPTGELKNRRLR